MWCGWVTVPHAFKQKVQQLDLNIIKIKNSIGHVLCYYYNPFTYLLLFIFPLFQTFRHWFQYFTLKLECVSHKTAVYN